MFESFDFRKLFSVLIENGQYTRPTTGFSDFDFNQRDRDISLVNSKNKFE